MRCGKCPFLSFYTLQWQISICFRIAPCARTRRTVCESLKTARCANPQREHTRRLTFFLLAWGERKCGPVDLKVQDPAVSLFCHFKSIHSIKTHELWISKVCEKCQDWLTPFGWSLFINPLFIGLPLWDHAVPRVKHFEKGHGNLYKVCHVNSVRENKAVFKTVPWGLFCR